MEEKKELTVLQPKNENEVTIYWAKEQFDLDQRKARVYACSTLVPKQYQGNIGNCIVALNMAKRMNCDEMMIMQNLAIVHGTPSFEAKFAIACFNATGKYTAIKYKTVGEVGKDTYGMQAYAIEKATGELVEGPTITIAMAKAEGWYNQNPKWKNIPDLMLRYRAASWFIRTTDPGVMMGFQTREEVEDITDDVVDFTEVNTPVGEDANTEQIVVPETEAAPAEEVAPPTAEPKKESEAQSEEASTEKISAGRPKKEEALGAQPTPDLFK